MMRKVCYILLFLTAVSAYGQLGGRATYQFLNLMSSPRQAALGGKIITNYDYDPDSALYNPANINYRMDNQLSVNYVNYLADINYGTASYAYLWDRRTQVLHAGITYVNYGSFDGRDENGNATGEFGGSEAALSLGYATNIPYTDFYVGANVKLITSTLAEYTSAGGAIDLGLTYNYEDWDLNIRILKAGFTFGIVREVLFNYVDTPGSRTYTATTNDIELRMYMYYKYKDLYQKNASYIYQQLINQNIQLRRRQKKVKQSMSFKLGDKIIGSLRVVKHILKFKRQ